MDEISLSDNDAEFACAAAIYLQFSGQFLKMRRKKRKKRCWMIPLHKSRKSINADDALLDLSKEPSGRFENLCQISASDFEHLICRIGPLIARQNTNMRTSISVQERLAVALRYFATGDSYTNLSYLFKFSKQSVSRCVDEASTAIIQELQEQVNLPKNKDDWLNIAQGFENDWNFPNCLGAIGGKHVIMQRIINTYAPSTTFNVALQALVDARYCFTFVDIGYKGRISDGGIFNKLSLFSEQEMVQMKFPPDKQLLSSQKKLPYVFISDSAFALSHHTMKPYPGILEKGSEQSIFNYRLSRAHRVVENVFGVMASVFRVLRKPLVLEPEKVRNVTLACVLLHNFMRRSQSSASTYTPPGTFDTEIDGEIIPGSWRNDQSEMTSFTPITMADRKPEDVSEAIRNSFAEYFATEGKLSWQDKYC